MYYYLVLKTLTPDYEYQIPIAIFDEYHQREAIELSNKRDPKLSFQTRFIIFIESEIESKSFFLLTTNNIYKLIESFDIAERLAFDMTSFEYFKSFPNVYNIINMNHTSKIIKIMDTKYLLSSPKNFLLKRQLLHAERKIKVNNDLFEDSFGKELMYECYYPKLDFLRKFVHLKNNMVDSLLLEYQSLGFH